MISAAHRPRLLLAAGLLCGFSLLGVIGYHTSPDRAAATAVSLPAATTADFAEARQRFEQRRRARAVREAADPGPGYTLNPHGPGLLPTRAPGGFVPAEEVTLEEPIPAATDSAEAAAPEPIPFSMPGPRRPASAGSRSDR